MKPPGSGEWVPHLDTGRKNTYQIVISLTVGSFVVWPGSHKHSVTSATDKYYPLSKTDLGKLAKSGIQKIVIPAQAGDVLVMVGGLLVHSSPAVAEGESVRIATYAHWKPLP